MGAFDSTASLAQGCAVLSPYLVPATLKNKRVVNMGDGFILRAIERHIGRFDPALVFTSREAPPVDALRRLDGARAIVVGGANQLNDHYAPWPGLTPEALRASRHVFVPFGVGIHGDPRKNQALSEPSREILRTMHERIEYSSWRCPRTVAYLEQHLPELAGRFLMTSCPVVYDRPLLESAAFHDGEATVAVTVTDRGGAFWERETQTLDFVARRFAKARRYLVLHENFRPPPAWEPWRNRLPYVSWLSGSGRARLRWYAASRGYELVAPRNADELLAFYAGVDLHVGSRLHAHLRFLSQNKRSFLTYVDERVTGIAESLGFPICDPARFDTYMDFDFEALRRRAQAGFDEMRRFLHHFPPLQVPAVAA
jgi:Polysaccharide pyruvyl transferase